MAAPNQLLQLPLPNPLPPVPPFCQILAADELHYDIHTIETMIVKREVTIYDILRMPVWKSWVDHNANRIAFRNALTNPQSGCTCWQRRTRARICEFQYIHLNTNPLLTSTDRRQNGVQAYPHTIIEGSF